jgi:hypothetical protein
VKYRIRNQHGELEFESLTHLKEAARLGLVDPNDEVLREGSLAWERVGSLAGFALSKTRRRFRIPWLHAALVTAAGAAGLLIRHGHRTQQFYWYAAGLTLAFAVVAGLIQVTASTQKRR